MIEIDAPILTTFVFARAADITDLLTAAKDPTSRHPDFSMLHQAGRIPLVADRDILGLREAEQRAMDVAQEIRDAESREEERRIRVAALRTEQARRKATRKALRDEHRHFEPDQRVQVSDMPAFAGMTGIVESSDGRNAVVVFGGSLVLNVETWQIAPIPL